MDIQSVIVSIEELNKTKNSIKEAIISKGVVSAGKFSKFPDEIKSISAGGGVNEQDVIHSILYRTKELDWNDNATELPDNFGQGIKFNHLSFPNLVSVDTNNILEAAIINKCSVPNLVSCSDILKSATVGDVDAPKLQSCRSFCYMGNIANIYLPEATSISAGVGGAGTTTVVLPKISNLYVFAFQYASSITQIYFGKDLQEFPILPSNYLSDAPALTVVLDTPQAIPISSYTNNVINTYISRGEKLIISVLDSAYDSFKASAYWNRYSQYLKKRSETPADRLEFLKKYKLN